MKDIIQLADDELPLVLDPRDYELLNEVDRVCMRAINTDSRSCLSLTTYDLGRSWINEDYIMCVSAEKGVLTVTIENRGAPF